MPGWIEPLRTALRMQRRRTGGTGRRRLWACGLLTWMLAGCAHFGVPDVPAELGEPPWHPDGVYVAYHPTTVLGFGHTAIIVRADPGETSWLRYDQLASAEARYSERLQDGTARFWQAVTSRLPSIFGLTREVVTLREGPSPAQLLYPGESLLPVSGVEAQAVREAAGERHARAPELEASGAPRYWVLFNNSHHFTRAVLGEGGPIHDHYFPKHFVQAYLDEPPEALQPRGSASDAFVPSPRDGGRGSTARDRARLSILVR